MKNPGLKIGLQQQLLTKKGLTILSLLAMFQEGIFLWRWQMKNILLMAGVCLLSFNVFADTKTEILIDKVDRMEAELALLQRKLYQNPSVQPVTPSADDLQNKSNAPANIDDFYSQLDAQNQVIQSLTEKVERLEFQLNSLGNKVDKVNTDVDFRLNELSSSKPSNSEPVSETKNGSDKDAYEAAYALLKTGDYDKAEQAFLKFMTDYPTSSYLGNANYWLGESYYARGQYAEAAGLFADGFTKYKDNTKAPDNMLKLGLAMKGLGKKTEACSAFKGLSDEFPKANEALKKRAKDEAKALKCPL